MNKSEKLHCRLARDFRCFLQRGVTLVHGGQLRAIFRGRSELVPGGLARLAAQLISLLEVARLSVWGPVLLRSCGFFGLLGLVAYLGHVARDFERYGGVRYVDSRVAEFLDATEPRGGHAAGVPVESDKRSRKEQTELLSQAATDAAKAAPPGCPEESKKGPSGIAPTGQVILNLASKEELTTLPGVGPARADAILALRARLGRFKRVSDLLRIKGIGYKSLQKLKDKVILDPPQAEVGGDASSGSSGHAPPQTAPPQTAPSQTAPSRDQLSPAPLNENMHPATQQLNGSRLPAAEKLDPAKDA